MNAHVNARRAWVTLTVLNASLGIASFWGKAIAGPDPAMLNGPWGSIIAVLLIGFLFTWPLALISGIISSSTLPPLESIDPGAGFCLTCGYSLRGLSIDRCPECGQSFDPENRHSFRSDLIRSRGWLPSVLWGWVIVAGCACAWFLCGLILFLC